MLFQAEPAHFFCQFIQIIGLAHVTVGFVLEAANLVAFIFAGGQDQNGDFLQGQNTADTFQEPKPIHDGHHEVQNHTLWSGFLDGGKAFGTIGRLDDIVTLARQLQPEDGAQIRIIFHDQDSGFRRVAHGYIFFLPCWASGWPSGILNAKAGGVPWNLTCLWLFLILVIDLDFYHLNGKGDFELQLHNKSDVPIPLLSRLAGSETWTYKQALFLLTLGIVLWASLPVMAQEPGDPDDPCAKGKNLYRAANFLEARKSLMECLNQSGPSVEVLLPLAVMAAREGRLSEAEKFSAEAVELDPSDPEAHYWHGRALLRLKRTEEARARWETGLTLGLNHMGILEGLARLALSEGEVAKGYQLLDQMRRQGMEEAWLYRLLADIAASRGLWAQSLGHLEDAMIKEVPTLSDLLAASELSIMAGKRDQALAYCRRAVTVHPGPDAYGGMGEAFFAVDQMDSALVYLRMAVEQDPANSQHRFNLANALEVTGAVDEADSHFKMYLAAQPNDAVGQFNYGVHLDKLGRSNEALHHVTRAIDLEPGMLSARVVRIQLLENVKRWDEALAEVDYLSESTEGNSAELAAWRVRIAEARNQELGAVREGKVHILHMVISQQDILDKVLESLEMGADFTELTVRYSGGPAAARGGDIGWIKPQDMVEPLRSAIEALEENEISPPVESRGLFHLFKRIP